MIFLMKFGINKHLQIAFALRACASLNNFTRTCIYSKLHSKSCDYLYKLHSKSCDYLYWMLRSICLQMVLRYKLRDTLHIVTNSSTSPFTAFSWYLFSVLYKRTSRNCQIIGLWRKITVRFDYALALSLNFLKTPLMHACFNLETLTSIL